MLRTGFLAVLAGCSSAWAADFASPRLDRLRAALAQDPSAAARFWEEITRSGAPLIEPIPGATDEVLVTFLWRGDASLSEVIVFASVFADNNPARQRLTHLAGSDVWYRSYRFPKQVPILYEISPAGTAKLQRDPWNSRFVDGRMGGSAAVLPGVRNLNWSTSKPAQQGRLEQTRINDRTIQVYLPAGFRPGQPYDVLVVLDQDVYSGPVPLSAILDNLIAAGEISPTVAVLVGNTDRAVDLSCSSKFSGFLATELLPAMEQRFAFRRQRGRTTIAGSSLGGLAAACAGLHVPDHFSNVIALSGSFRWRPSGDREPEWLARELAARPPVSVRFFIGVGSYETGTPNEPGNPSLLTASRHLRDVLRAKGYTVAFQEFPGAHDPLSWTTVLPDALTWSSRTR